MRILRVTVDPKSGCITSLFDKRANFESLASGACGNQLQTFKDTPKDYDAWNIDPGTLDHMTPIETVDAVEVDRKGAAARRDPRVAHAGRIRNSYRTSCSMPAADQVDVVERY